jgi:hypothetical protein
MLTMLLLTVVNATGHCSEQQSFSSTGMSRVEAEETYSIVVTSLRDRDGLRRDTWYFLGYQAAAIAILYAMPESVTGWTDEQKSGYSMSIWWDNVRNPTWDSDDFAINYILHPYWGAAYYVRARERGYPGTEAFWYSAMLSAMYEFGAEALFEQPSIQDLIVTPVLGSLVGAYFMNVRTDIRERTHARGNRSTGDKWLWVLTDPLGALNRQVDKLFGRETELMISPSFSTRRLIDDPYSRPFLRNQEKVIGLNISLAW